MTADRNPAYLVSSGGAHPDPADLPLYAMQLLAAGAASSIAAHLSRCEECRAELARIHGDLASVAMTVDLDTPSAHARQRLLGQVAREVKARPAAAPAPAQPDAAPRPLAVPSFGRTTSSMDESKPKRGTRLIVLTGIGWAAAAVLCLVSGLLLHDREDLRKDLGTQDDQLARLDADAASAHRLMDALTDPGAMRVAMHQPATTKPQAVPSGGVTYNPLKGSLIFLAANMDRLEEDKTYELWIIPADNSAPIPAGTFHPDQQGNASVIMPDLPRGIAAKAFGITIEPEGGSQIPTMPLVLFGN